MNEGEGGVGRKGEVLETARSGGDEKETEAQAEEPESVLEPEPHSEGLLEPLSYAEVAKSSSSEPEPQGEKRRMKLSRSQLQLQQPEPELSSEQFKFQTTSPLQTTRLIR